MIPICACFSIGVLRVRINETVLIEDNFDDKEIIVIFYTGESVE